MKRLIILALALLLSVFLAACDDENQSGILDGITDGIQDILGSVSTGGDFTNTVSGFDINAVLSGTAGDQTVWGMENDSVKQEIISAAEEAGFDVTFGANGSMTLTDPKNGDVFIQNPDGTWSIKTDSGIAQVGGSWPDNEFTRLIPKPDFTLIATNTSESEFSTSWQGATVEQAKAYAAALKTAGFTVNVYEDDFTDQGVENMYSFSALNAEGYSVSVSVAMGIGAIVVTAP